MLEWLDFLPQLEKGKYLQYKKELKVERDPTQFRGPRADGGRYVHFTRKGEHIKEKVTCEGDHVFCSNCHQSWHPGKGCVQARRQGTLKFKGDTKVRK